MYTRNVQLLFQFGPVLPREPWLSIGPRKVAVLFVRSGRARRYVMRVTGQGTVRVTVPRRGTTREALEFARKHCAWVERQLLDLSRRASTAWREGTEILFRGARVRLSAETYGEQAVVRLGPETIRVKDLSGDWRPELERHLYGLARRELPARVVELAAFHGFDVNRVTVRNQKSRWGSCSRKGTISLNWRLIQAPEQVRDYIIFHELAHFTHMNHSARFWKEVERLCPDYGVAEQWLKSQGRLLR